MSAHNEYYIDLYHMAATISAILYKSSSSDGFKQGLMPEKHLDNLAGWAGDLQTFVYDCAFYAVNNDADFDDYFNLYLVDDDSRCGITDLNSDSDAINITSKIFQSNSFKEILSKYYSSEFSNRFSLFLSNGLNNSQKSISVYTNKKYITVTWPIYDYKKNEDGYVDIKSEYSKKASEIFWDYINNLADKE